MRARTSCTPTRAACRSPPRRGRPATAACRTAPRQGGSAERAGETSQSHDVTRGSGGHEERGWDVTMTSHWSEGSAEHEHDVTMPRWRHAATRCCGARGRGTSHDAITRSVPPRHARSFGPVSPPRGRAWDQCDTQRARTHATWRTGGPAGRGGFRRRHVTIWRARVTWRAGGPAGRGCSQ